VDVKRVCPLKKNMKLKNLLGWSSALCLSASVVQAQETSDVEKLNKQLKQLKETFEKQHRETKENFERLLHEQQAQINALRKQLDAQSNGPPALAQPVAAASAVAPTLPAKAWSPSDPIRVAGSGQNYITLSVDGLFVAGTSTANDIESLQLGGHDPKQRGFTVQNLETTLEGKVDPYFRGQANIVLQIDPQGETTIEAEEAYLETMSLPWNLQVKGGQFFTEFGRLNPTHPHTWDFADQPLVNGRFFGEDGLRNPGARVSWLTPTPFYSELFFAIQNSQGGTAHSFRSSHDDELFLGRPSGQGRVKNFSDMLFAPRYAASFNLSDAQTIVAGASAAFGPNGSGEHGDTQIYGLDLFWKWKPVNHHAGFPFVSWQTEGMLRKFRAGAFSNVGDDSNSNGVIDPGESDVFGDQSVRSLPGETLTDYGLYTQVAYGFRKGWVAALRGDWVGSDTAQYERLFGRDLDDRGSRWRISPNLTYYPSEFSKIRLQYNFDRRNGIGDDHSVWLQFEFLLGAHAAHKF
jgi:hypothetical protein